MTVLIGVVGFSNEYCMGLVLIPHYNENFSNVLYSIQTI